MQFVKAQELKIGMRLARPIYNRNGVLLYERNSKLTQQGITAIANFGLIGIFILEPAEPVPPMTQEDIEFERFQTMNVFAIEEELQKIIRTKKAPKTQVIAANIIRAYGHLDKKINFIQSLRSKEDYVYKHSLNVSILCAMMTHVLNVKLEEQLDTVIAGFVHDIGKLMLPKEIAQKTVHTKPEIDMIIKAELDGFNLIEDMFASNPGIKRSCLQSQRAVLTYEKTGSVGDIRLTMGAKILTVADAFDKMTAMQFEAEPASEVQALRELINNPELYDPVVVDALVKSISILGPGTSVELTSGEKGLVLAQNNSNILKPMILTFGGNKILDLSNLAYSDLEIKDIMKTLDNRYIMDTSSLKKMGLKVEEPEYVDVPEEEEEYVPGRDF